MHTIVASEVMEYQIILVRILFPRTLEIPSNPHDNPLLREERKGLKLEFELEVSHFMGKLFVYRVNGTKCSLVDDRAQWIWYPSDKWNCARNCGRIRRTAWTLTTKSCSSHILASLKWYSITNFKDMFWPNNTFQWSRSE